MGALVVVDGRYLSTADIVVVDATGIVGMMDAVVGTMDAAVVGMMNVVVVYVAFFDVDVGILDAVAVVVAMDAVAVVVAMDVVAVVVAMDLVAVVVAMNAVAVVVAMDAVAVVVAMDAVVVVEMDVFVLCNVGYVSDYVFYFVENE